MQIDAPEELAMIKKTFGKHVPFYGNFFLLDHSTSCVFWQSDFTWSWPDKPEVIKSFIKRSDPVTFDSLTPEDMFEFSTEFLMELKEWTEQR
mgnify:CR=1 FL=1